MNTYSVEFQNQFFKIKTEHDQEVFQTLKSEVDKKLEEIQGFYKNISLEKALFLACLQFSEDKYLFKKTIDKNIDRLESQAKSLLDDLKETPAGLNFQVS